MYLIKLRKYKKHNAKRAKKEKLKYKYILAGKSIAGKIFYLRKISEKNKLRLDKNYKLLRDFTLPSVKGKCEVCQINEAYCWHHIVPLSKGGCNADYNLIRICIDCHHAVHPFMK